MEGGLLAAFLRGAIVIAGGIGVYALCQSGLERVRAAGRLTTNAEFIARTVVKWLLAVVVAITVLQQFSISVHALWTALSAVFVLVAVGFVAQWSILSNMLCAVFLVLFAPFRIGDRIEIIEVVLNDGSRRGLVGRVTSIDLIYTTLVDDGDPGSTLRVPNNMLFQRAIRTIHGEQTRSLGSELFDGRAAVERDGRRSDEPS